RSLLRKGASLEADDTEQQRSTRARVGRRSSGRHLLMQAGVQMNARTQLLSMRSTSMSGSQATILRKAATSGTQRCIAEGAPDGCLIEEAQNSCEPTRY